MRPFPRGDGDKPGGSPPDFAMRSWLFPGGEPLGSTRRGARIVVRGEAGQSVFRLDLDGPKGTISV
ncbi:hypothetical protein NS365_07550 [Aureimonas ureilytica]|uniref:Uncharacterized protein n=1 Tax=Aureimonas ureilytica TaxID=401562 RepID=A0A175RS88_9HYPH|nr:hypothetical protein [Aureimonas ureilytica]KTR06273.1 hypothetical protein NS365_07550 [Aureimonas ureilytica]